MDLFQKANAVVTRDNVLSKQKAREKFFFESMRACWSSTILSVCKNASINDTVAVAVLLVSKQIYLLQGVTPRSALASLDDSILLELRSMNINRDVVDIISYWRDEGNKRRRN